MRIVYLGTPPFAVPTLEAILRAGHEVIEVITQPDRPKGRGNKLAMPAVKVCALAHNLPVFQPERIRRPEAVENLLLMTETKLAAAQRKITVLEVREKKVMMTGTVFQTATAKAQRMYLDRRAFSSAARFSFTMLLKRPSHAKNLMIRMFCNTSFVV